MTDAMHPEPALAALDVPRLRADTPGCEAIVHFNNAGAALQPRPVLDAVLFHLRREAQIGGYEAAEEADGRREAVYSSIARLIGGAPDEIAIIENATRAFDMAFHSIRFADGDVILTSVTEYASNYMAYLRLARDRRVAIRVVPEDDTGQLSLPDLERVLGEGRVRLVAVSHVPTESGLVQPAEEIGRLARQAGALYLLDACQSVGQLPVDVRAIGCHMLSATSRKFLRGPRGVGFLYVARDLLPDLHPPFVDLHAARWLSPEAYELRPDARRFENWESSVAATLGLGAAVDYALELGLPAIWSRVQGLGAALRRGLTAIDGVHVQDRGRTLGGIVSFSVDGLSAARIKESLAALPRRVNVTISRGEYAVLDLQPRGLEAVVRASVHYYNTEDEIEEFLRALRLLVRRAQ